MRFLFVLFVMLLAPAAQAQVVATIKPLHSLTAAVMEGSGEVPLLLVDGQTSPHHFSLKPSQRRALEYATLVFYISDDFELFLTRTFEALPDAVTRVPMDKTPGLTLYPLRSNPKTKDLHIWLDPKNAKIMTKEIARRLSVIHPEHHALYEANVKKLEEKIDALDATLTEKLAPFSDEEFIVAHDAYQYFEKAYGLRAAGVIHQNADQPPSAKHMQELHAFINARPPEDTSAYCVFDEPGSDNRIAFSLVRQTRATTLSTLDPEGRQFTPGPKLYFDLMRVLAATLESCFNCC